MIKRKLFHPPWHLSNPHIQTLWPFLFRSRRYPYYEMERLELPDGDFVDLLCSDPGDSKATVVMLHGLEGSYRSHYVPVVMNSLVQNNFRVILMHFRGCSGESNRLDRAYHSGDTGDLAYLIQTLKERNPVTPIFAIGVSLGGNVLLKWLGESGASNPLLAAVAVSVPFQLNVVADTLEKGFSRVYQYYLLRSLLKNTRQKFTNRPAPFDLAILKKIKTIREFDNLITAPLHGFSSAEHYYQECSSRRYLTSIQTSTLIIHAEDDPFMTPDVVPRPEELSQSTVLELSAKGGHVGFVASGTLWNYNTLLSERIKQFFLQHINDD